MGRTIPSVRSRRGATGCSPRSVPLAEDADAPLRQEPFIARELLKGDHVGPPVLAIAHALVDGRELPALAAKVLADAGQPLNANSIAERAISAGWKTNGKTPGATLYAAIIREIAKRGKDARFAKHDRGVFVAGKMN